MAPDFRTTDHRASCWELLLLSVATISVSGEEKEESRGSWDHLARSWGGWWGAGVRRKGGGLRWASLKASLLCVSSRSSSRESPQEPQPHAGGKDLDSGLGSSAS